MANELDLSAFDEDDKPEAAPALDLSAFDDAPEVAEAQAPESNDPVGDSTRGLVGGTAGAYAGKKTSDLAGGIIDFGMSKIGALKKPEIDFIDTNRLIYPKVSPLENIMQQFKDLAQKSRQGGFDSADEAVESIRNMPNIPIEDYYKTIAKPAATNPDLSDALPENIQAKIFGSKLDEIAPAQQEDLKSILGIDEQMNQPFQDERLGINQSIKDAQYENKLGQLSTPAAPDLKKPIVADFAAKQQAQKLQELEAKLAQASGKTNQPVLNTKEDLTFNIDNRADKNNKLNELSEARGQQPDYERQAIVNDHDIKRDNKKLGRLDEKASQAQEKIQTEVQKIEEKKLKFQESLANSKEKSIALENVNSSNAKAKVDIRKDQLVFNKILSDEKTSQMKNLKQKEKMESLLAQKQKLEEKMKKRVETVQSAAAEEFTAAHNTPKEILAVTPELQNRVLKRGYADSLKKGMEDTNYIEEMTRPSFHNKLRAFQEADTNYEQGGVVNNFRKDMAGAMSQKLKDESDDYKNLMAKSEDSFKTEELWGKNGINYSKPLDRITLDDGGRSKINQVLINPQDNISGREYMVEALEDAKKNGHLQAGDTVDDLMNTADVSALKNDVSRLRQGKDINGFDANSIAKLEYSRTPGIFLKQYGTAAQEAYALNKGIKPSLNGTLDVFKDLKNTKSLGDGLGKVGSMIGKGGMLAAKGLAKVGGPLAGFLGGSMLAANAMDEGRIGPVEAASLAMAESVNQTPLDLVEGYAQGKEGAQSAANDYKSSQEYWDKADGSVPLENLAKGALEGAGKGLAAATEEDFLRNPNAQMATRNPLAGGMIDASEGDYAYAEKQLADMRKATASSNKPAKPHEEFKSFVEQRPEQIEELAQLFSGDDKTSSFVAPLQKAAQADERTKSAVLFGLYQQPAFRQAMKSKKGM